MSEPSKQIKYQRRMVEEGRCKICGKPRSDNSKQFCDRHLRLSREYARRRLGIPIDIPLMGKGRRFKWDSVDWKLTNKMIAKNLGCTYNSVVYQRKKRIDAEASTL